MQNNPSYPHFQPICNIVNQSQFPHNQVNFANNNQLQQFVQKPQNPLFNQQIFPQQVNPIGQCINQQLQFQQKQQFIEKEDKITISGIEYRKLKSLGRGSYGQVFLIQNKQTLELFALKTQSQLQKEEEEILLKLKSKSFKNLVNIVEFQKSPETNEYLLVMEYCQNSLQNEINIRAIDKKDARYVIKQIANGIKELHEMNIIHRDLKPENILVFVKKDQNTKIPQNIYKICDFGLSSTKQFSKTIQCGTAHYMPPEQIMLQQNFKEGYDKSVDIWAFGTVIYELFTTKVMFMKSNKQEIYDEILKVQQPVIDAKLRKDLTMFHQEYVSLVQRMIQVDPKKRIEIDEIMNELKKGSKNITNHNQQQQFGKQRSNSVGNSQYNQKQNQNIFHTDQQAPTMQLWQKNVNSIQSLQFNQVNKINQSKQFYQAHPINQANPVIQAHPINQAQPINQANQINQAQQIHQANPISQVNQINQANHINDSKEINQATQNNCNQLFVINNKIQQQPK